MKTRTAAIAVMAVFIVLVPAAAIMYSSGSDAVDDAYVNFYYNQLTPDQKDIYDKLKAVDTDPVVNTDYCYFDVVIDIPVSTQIEARADIEKALGALRLDDPYAMAAWTKADQAFSFDMDWSFGTLEKVQVRMDIMFEHAVSMRDDAKAIINGIEIKGDDVPEKVDSINDALIGKEYKFDKDDGATGIYGILGDGDHKLDAFGFAAVFKALATKADINAMQVYGTLADGSKNILHAWDLVVVGDGQVYAVDPAINNKNGGDTWLLVGRYTVSDGESFARNHLAFAFNTSAKVEYDFGSELMCNDGYEWPENKGIMDILTEYAPWIFIGIICVVLALVLIRMAKKGEM